MSWLTSDTGIIFTHVVLSTIVLISIIFGRGPWAIKAPMILIVPFMGFLILASIQSHAGWPVAKTPPEGSQITYSYVVEPNPVTHNDGAIYIWCIPPGASEPRAYELPYTRQAHEQVEKAGKAMKRGIPMQFKKIGQKILAYRLPPPALPTKERG